MKVLRRPRLKEIAKSSVTVGDNSYALLIRAELHDWQEAYGELARSFIKTLADEYALITSFAFCFDSHGELTIE